MHADAKQVLDLLETIEADLTATLIGGEDATGKSKEDKERSTEPKPLKQPERPEQLEQPVRDM